MHCRTVPEADSCKSRCPWSCAPSKGLRGRTFPCLFLAVRLWKESFFWAAALNSGLKIPSKPCCKQMCSPQLRCSVPRAQSRFSMIPKGPRTSRKVNECWLESHSCISPEQERPPVLGASEPGAGFLSGDESPGLPSNVHSQYRFIGSTLKICCLVWPLGARCWINYHRRSRRVLVRSGRLNQISGRKFPNSHGPSARSFFSPSHPLLVS